MKAELRQRNMAMTVSVRRSQARSQADEQGCDRQGSQESKGWARRRESTAASKGTEPAASAADALAASLTPVSVDRSHNTSRRKSPPAQVCSHNRPAANPKPFLSWLAVRGPPGEIQQRWERKPQE